MLIFYGAFYAHRRSKNLLCGCKRKKKYEWKLLILMFWDCWCCKTAFNIADISGNECRNGMLVCLAIEILLWHGNEAINSFHLTVDSILIDRIERNRSFEHIIFVVVLPSKRTQFHSTWILGYCIWCANQIFAKSAFPSPAKSNQNIFRFSNSMICIFQIEQIECDYYRMDCHWPNKIHAIMWFSSSVFL